ncbi:tripartite tricarboxylate transporter substrate binding protein [Bradyrhizobium sp. Pear77]|uniref:Bug family tripartite tricarboxylate transporter substrate binding protein n=1 Tax=Bradyrhizobium altum TaxID=1571202 RepID=UPI001E37C45E|nr:tripartite tricarboxylate transporter substrate binding protein [Bradyrhizobium altum]MCC8954688.1 tripartite tricarboxylate transporter substrate binding protein [Bradyrhizobium altum]
MITRRNFTFSLAALTLVSNAVNSASANAYPAHPIRMVVPFPAGGSTDVGARLIAEHLSRSLGQQVYVENRSGANGTIGVDAVAKSAPDGYTILATIDTVASNQFVFNTDVDPVKDLAPIIEVSRQPIVVVAHPALAVSTLAELIALAKRQPGLRYGTGSGLGSPQHMAMQWLGKLAGVTFEQVPYRGGGQAINDLLGGHITLGCLGSTPVMPHYKAGTLRVLAQSTATRSPGLPDVPTFEEAGVAGLVLEQWLGIFAPGHTPEAITTQLNTEIGRALSDQAVRKGLLDSAQEPMGGSAEEFTSRVGAASAQYARLVKELNIRPE